MTSYAIVLAGGASRRMGRDKASLPFGPQTMLERVTDLIRPEVSEIVVSAGKDQTIPPGLRVVRDLASGAGPLSALATVLPIVAAESPAGIAVVVACDMPLVRHTLIAGLSDRIGEADACVPLLDGRMVATCAVFRIGPSARAAVELVARGERRLGALPEALHTIFLGPHALRTLDPELLSFVACNTPEEYERALALARLGPGRG
jgi:molybdopterin-guanine dinucleotide biosynthesis protein A